MIKVTMLRQKGRTTGFTCGGHAGYAEEGSDIVCSAVSALTTAVVNGLTEVAGIAAKVSDNGKLLSCSLPECLSERQCQDAQLLLDTFEMALNGIRRDYGKYLKIVFREV